jgi:hypothetical protein
MKTRNILLLVIFGLGILGGAVFTKAQNLSSNKPACFKGERVLLEFNLAGSDNTPMGPGNPKAPVLMPTVWQDGYLLDFQGTHADYALHIVDASNTVVYSVAVPSNQTLVWLPTILIGTYELQLYDGGAYYFYSEIEL